MKHIAFSMRLYKDSSITAVPEAGGETSVGSLVAPHTVLPFIKADLLKEKKFFIARQTTQRERCLAMFVLYPYRTQRAAVGCREGHMLVCVCVSVSLCCLGFLSHTHKHVIWKEQFSPEPTYTHSAKPLFFPLIY